MLSQALGPADAAPDHPVDHPDPDNGTPAELVTTLADIVIAPDDQAELQAKKVKVRTQVLSPFFSEELYPQ